MDKKCLLIIDSNSLIHRGFHALPPLRNKKGEIVNAVYGFLLIFFKTIEQFNPEYVVACFDFPAPSFRHKEYKEYKATRKPTPETLISQFPKMKEILEVLSISVFEKKGYEADDLIGTIAEKARQKDLEMIILSGDKDMLQLVNNNTKVFLLKTGIKNAILYGKEEIMKEFGMTPEEIIDYKALRGDPSDNIKGAEGVGEKTALTLIKDFSNIKNLFNEIENNSEKSKKIKEKLKKLLLNQKESIILSKFLVTIKKDIKIDFNLKNCFFGDYNKNEVLKVFEKYGFKSLIQKIDDKKTKEEIKKNLTLF